MNTPSILALAAAMAVLAAASAAQEPMRSPDDSAASQAAAGRAAWLREHRPGEKERPRACTSCHGANLTKPGRHVETGKHIEPMAVSVNPTRLDDPKKVEKWFRRNCRWTIGRECTLQEKREFIRFISSQ
jgi:hypothetical protein